MDPNLAEKFLVIFIFPLQLYREFGYEDPVHSSYFVCIMEVMSLNFDHIVGLMICHLLS